jgi:hypothetical protein
VHVPGAGYSAHADFVADLECTYFRVIAVDADGLESEPLDVTDSSRSANCSIAPTPAEPRVPFQERFRVSAVVPQGVELGRVDGGGRAPPCVDVLSSSTLFA